jgi:succinate dehydrogenase hydrophobic anchor subunit
VDISVILIRITGVIILLFTIRNVVLHIKKESKEAKAALTQSSGERFLNGVLFYLFLAFITAFSLGMIFNN